MGDSPSDRYRRLLERDRVGGDPGTLTRRRLVGALGGAAVAASALPPMALGSEAAGEWETAAAASGTVILGSGVTGRAVVGLIGKVAQVGVHLTAVGYLTSLRGLKDSQLFSVARGTDFRDPNSNDEGQARLTFYSETEIGSLSATGRPGGASGDLGTIVANAGGALGIYFRGGGGADFDDPLSFKQGKQVAAFSCSFQDNLTLQPPDFLTLASVALGGSLTQTVARTFAIAGKQSQIAKVGAQRALAATGWGELTDPEEPRSTLWLAGVLSVVGKDP
jgi:hypothetical protein